LELPRSKLAVCGDVACIVVLDLGEEKAIRGLADVPVFDRDITKRVITGRVVC
jgi:hypothetical protein